MTQQHDQADSQGEILPVPASWVSLYEHPGWDDPSWRSDQGRDLFDTLVDAYGYDQARRMWVMACNYLDHIAYAHNGGECDC